MFKNIDVAATMANLKPLSPICMLCATFILFFISVCTLGNTSDKIIALGLLSFGSAAYAFSKHKLMIIALVLSFTWCMAGIIVEYDKTHLNAASASQVAEQSNTKQSQTKAEPAKEKEVSAIVPEVKYLSYTGSIILIRDLRDSAKTCFNAKVALSNMDIEQEITMDEASKLRKIVLRCEKSKLDTEVNSIN